MKRITLLILILLFTFSTIAFAQQEQTYEADDYFRVIVPANYQVLIPDEHRWLIVPPNKNFELTIGISPIDNSSLDERVNTIVNDLTGPMSFKIIRLPEELLVGFQLIETETFNIDNHDARRLLFSLNTINNRDAEKILVSFDKFDVEKEYKLFIIIDSGNYRYNIAAGGNYDNLETDRKIIDQIITSIKILR